MREGEYMTEKIAAFAVESMLYEVAATPKPGLVDRANNGAHNDMDFFTFMSSAAALHDTFDRMIKLGVQKQSSPIQELLPMLRKEGRLAEKKMFEATDGVNTHKGMIFSLGILCGCCGWILGRNDKEYGLSSDGICGAAKQMCKGICERDFARIESEEHLTKGEQMFIRYGFKGVRGIVESGYEVVRDVSLPVYRMLKRMDISENAALVHTLLYIMRETDDTNIASRHDLDMVHTVKRKAAKIIDAGGMLSPKGRQMVLDMDAELIDKYVSPGGCADLLAVTHFLYCVDELYKQKQT